MRIENTFIAGLKIIHLNEFTDVRGSFIKVMNKDVFMENGLEHSFDESYFSISAKNVIRGMHFQIPPYEHTKLVYINSGKIIDVVVDLRKKSDTFGQFFSIELNTTNPKLIYIPVGCAHGFKSLKNNTMVTYLQSSCYNSKADSGIKYDSFGMDWEIEEPIISERDSSFITLKDFISPF